jgi:hypothetical protein
MRVRSENEDEGEGIKRVFLASKVTSARSCWSFLVLIFPRPLWNSPGSRKFFKTARLGSENLNRIQVWIPKIIKIFLSCFIYKTNVSSHICRHHFWNNQTIRRPNDNKIFFLLYVAHTLYAIYRRFFYTIRCSENDVYYWFVYMTAYGILLCCTVQLL